jgi:hypothetical protein
LLLYREQYNELAPKARRAGLTVSAYILSVLVKAGEIEGRKRGRA